MEKKDNKPLLVNTSKTSLKTSEEIFQEYTKALKEKRYPSEKIAKKQKEVTLMDDRVLEAVFSDNKNNPLLAGIANAMRKIHNLTPIAKVLNSQVEKTSIWDVLFGRKMIADLIGEGEKAFNSGKINITAEVQKEQAEAFATRGTLSSGNVMRTGFEKGADYSMAPDVIGINILGFKLPELHYTETFCSRIVRTNFDAPKNFFLADKYSDYYLEIPKLGKKEQFDEKYHELWDILQVFKTTIENQEEDIRMGVITSPIAMELSREFKVATGDPHMIEQLLTEDEFRAMLAQHDLNVLNKGHNEGRVEGAEKNATETAIEMLNRNYDPVQISEILRRPIEWVNKLM